MSDIIKTQRSLAIKAMHNPTHQFDHLYRIICQDEWIRTALEGVLSNKGARTAGIDGMTKKDLASEEARRALEEVWEPRPQDKRAPPNRAPWKLCADSLCR